MAYVCPTELDGFMPHLSKQDTKFRQQLGTDLLSFLAEPSNSIVCQDIGQFIDSLIPWLQSCNHKISSCGLEIMTCLVDRLGHDFKPYLQTVLPVVIDRLGDSKDTVREKAQLLILKLLERSVSTPQHLLEKLSPGFTHKNAKIREEVLRCLVNIVNEHGAHSVTLSKFTPPIVKLLSDPTVTIRDTAFTSLVDLYKHVGDKLRNDLQKRNLVPASKLPGLLNRFDEVRDAGELLPTASSGGFDFNGDEVDRVPVTSKPIVPIKKPGLGSAMLRSTPLASRNASASSANTAGAVDEELFMKLFMDVPTVQIYSQKELGDQIKNISEIISDSNKDWNKRTDALKKIRSLVFAGATSYDDFLILLRSLEYPLQTTIKDLRSQVVREACITIAFLSQTLGIKFDHAAECILNNLINLIQNSAKVVATAGLVCLKFIIQYTQNPRLIPIITNNLNSKSKEIRKSCCEFLELLLNSWPTHSLEKHISNLQDALKKGIADADPDARVSSRKAFKGFRDHFPDQADALLQSLDAIYKKALQGELCLSSSSSSGSLAQSGLKGSKFNFKTPSSTTGSTENLCGGLQRAPSLPRSYRQRSGIPVLSRDNSGKKGFRSNSAIDLQAAQRAKARAQYAAINRHKVTSGTASLQGATSPQARPKKNIEPVTSSERVGRTRTKRSGVSHSQPTSRSGSPSYRQTYIYNRGGTLEHDSPRRIISGIPRSTAGSRDTSREGSPTRGQSLSRFRRNSDRPPLSPATRPVMAQKILQQSREAESALADALYDQADSGDFHRLSSPRKSGHRSLENHSDNDSETSSVCSERSYDSYRRASDSYSWSGSQQRLSSRDMWEPCREITEIIKMCASTTWQERKDGLVSLRCYLNTGAQLTNGELIHLTEIFTRMFMDAHTKGLSVFLDTLNEVIKKHKHELHDWLYILLQRVLYKVGTDLLCSTQGKLINTLEIIKKSFPIPLQITLIYRFLLDSTQTPNTKVKVAVLNFLTSLCNLAEPSQFVSKPPAKQVLLKIINFSQDPKSTDIRNAAKICIVAMWNCNTSQVTMLLAELPKEQQDIASTIVNNHMRRSSTGSEPGSPLVGSSPKALSPSTPTCRNDDINQEEIYKSLRKTTSEIQNYSYETLGAKLDRDRDTTSQDSGISQMSVGNDVKNDIANLEERMEELNIRQTLSSNETKSLPYSINGTSDGDSNGNLNLKSLTDEELVNKVLEFCLIDNPTPVAEKRKLLTSLAELIQKGRTEHVILQFKKLLRILLDNLKEKQSSIQVLVLQILSEIFKSESMKECWSKFVELLTLRVLDAYTENARDVAKMAEMTATAMTVFPFEVVVNVLSPLIQTSNFPTILSAIKMLTKFIETQPTTVRDEHLQMIVPGLIAANDHDESPVRKSAVFCMVAIHKAVGEERLAPYINQLSGSKLKLLRLYISRAYSAPTSTRSSGNS